ncbi:MAG: response regulator [Planctomycetota bacterium]
MEARVLLVDDEADFVAPLLKRMKKRQIDIAAVGSGEEALEFLRHEPVDVVVLDLKMPGMNGIETLREIKSRHPLVEVIMLTAHANVKDALEGMKCAAFDYLMKPIELEQLLYKIDDAFKLKTIRQSKQGPAGPGEPDG